MVKDVAVVAGKQLVVEYKKIVDRKCNANDERRQGDKYKARMATGAV